MLELTLTHADGSIIAAIGDTPLAGPTPADTLPRITRDENPYRYDPIGLGQRLYAALGGDALRARLDADPDATLLLITGEEAAKIPWEYAATADGVQLATEYGMLRLLPDVPVAPPPPQNAPLNLAV